MVVQAAKVIPYDRSDGEEDIHLKYPWRPVDALRIAEEELQISEAKRLRAEAEVAKLREQLCRLQQGD